MHPYQTVISTAIRRFFDKQFPPRDHYPPDEFTYMSLFVDLEINFAFKYQILADCVATKITSNTFSETPIPFSECLVGKWTSLLPWVINHETTTMDEFHKEFDKAMNSARKVPQIMTGLFAALFKQLARMRVEYKMFSDIYWEQSSLIEFCKVICMRAVALQIISYNGHNYETELNEYAAEIRKKYFPRSKMSADAMVIANHLICTALQNLHTLDLNDHLPSSYFDEASQYINSNNGE